ncbi:MAG: nuclear transport factor 2 family protein [Bacteroidia bacterium]
MQKIHIRFFSLLFICMLSACGGKEVSHQLKNDLAQKDSIKTYVPVSEALYREIYLQDSLLFAAFNAHDSASLMNFFTPDLEFFHDKGGLSDLRGTASGFQRLFANNTTTGLRRDLVQGSMEVYPIANYGAVQTMLHRFCHLENGKQDCGTFKNMMIWKKTDAGWKVSRVVSYDH